LIESLLKTDYFFFFEDLARKFPKIEPTVIASVLSSTLKEIERKEKVEIKLKEEQLIEFFDALNRGFVFKEAAYDILKKMNEGKSVEEAVKELGLTPLTKEEILKIIEETKKEVADKKKLIGVVLSKVRGRANISEVIKMIEKLS
jgi:glutamyl-tRNA(Gln) amidotransferase subunit E